MSYDSLTIGGHVTNTLPAWRQAITSTLVAHTLGPANVDVAARAIFAPNPGGVVPWGIQLDCTTGDPASQMLAGWNDSDHAPSMGGMFGQVLMLGAGEGYWGNYSMTFDLESGQLGVLDNMHWCTSEAQAAAQDADAYYSPSDAAALPASREIVESDGGAWYSQWVTDGKPYPLKKNDWVFRRKASSYSHGNNRHYVGRYDAAAVLSKELTGNGAEALIVNGNSWRGPWGAGPTPTVTGSSGSDWHAVVASDGSTPRSWLFWRNLTTGVWNRVATRIPDGVGASVNQNPAFVDRANKRVYFMTWFGGAVKLYYLDLANGIDNATWSTVVTLTTSGPSTVEPGERGTWIFTDDHPTGRRLAFGKVQSSLVPDGSRDNYWVCVDIDASTYTTFGPINGLTLDNSTERNLNIGGDYIPTYGSYGALLLTSRSSISGLRSYLIPLPADPTNGASYTGVTNSTVTLAPGVTLDTLAGAPNVKAYGRKGGYFPDLGTAIINQAKGPWLVYRPF